jgi:hypothetical protein
VPVGTSARRDRPPRAARVSYDTVTSVAQAGRDGNRSESGGLALVVLASVVLAEARGP